MLQRYKLLERTVDPAISLTSLDPFPQTSHSGDANVHRKPASTNMINLTNGSSKSDMKRQRKAEDIISLPALPKIRQREHRGRPATGDSSRMQSPDWGAFVAEESKSRYHLVSRELFEFEIKLNYLPLGRLANHYSWGCFLTLFWGLNYGWVLDIFLKHLRKARAHRVKTCY